MSKNYIPKRITKLDELEYGNKIWTIVDGETTPWKIYTYVGRMPITGNLESDFYGVFLNNNFDGVPKFHESKLAERPWFIYEDTHSCWAYIYNEVAKHYKEQMNIALEDAKYNEFQI